MCALSHNPVSLEMYARSGVAVHSPTFHQACKILHLNPGYNCICCGKALKPGQVGTRVLEKRGMKLRPRIQAHLKEEEMGETIYYVPWTGARMVHLTCVARGKKKPDGQIIGSKNWTEYCAETDALETGHEYYKRILNKKIREEKRLLAERKVADEQWQALTKEAKALWKIDDEIEAERKNLESICTEVDKQLDKLRIMKWICAEWGLRLLMYQDRPVTMKQRPYHDWYVDLGMRLNGKSDGVDTNLVMTHRTNECISFYEQPEFFRKRLCGLVGGEYFEENPIMQDFLYKKTKYGAGRRISFWKR